MSDSSEELSRLLNRVIEGEAIDWAAESGRFTDAGDRSRLTALMELDTVARRFVTTDVSVAPSPPEPLAAWGPLQVRRMIREDQDGTNYEAWDPEIERRVALSIFPLRGYDTDARATLLETVLAYCMLRSRHIAIVYGAQIRDEHLGIWSEWVTGRSLQEILLRDGPLSVEEACLLGISICQALSVMHADGLLCGALSPERVVRENGGRVVITELPISVLAEFAIQSRARTRPPGVLPPDERQYGGHGVQIDIRGLGILLEHVVNGTVLGPDRIEHRGAEGAADTDSAFVGPPPAPIDNFRAVIDRALDRTPHPGFESAGDMERALLALIQGRPPGPVRPSNSA